MNVLMPFLGLVVLLIVLHLVRLVARDGLGSLPAPRSHEAELGTWADRQLRR